MLVFVILGRNSPTALPLSPKLFPKMKQFRGGTNFSMNGNENIGWPATSRNPVAKIGKTKIKVFTPKNVIYHFHMYWLNLPRRSIVACLCYLANDGRPTIPTLRSQLPEFDFQLEKLLFSWMINPEKRKLQWQVKGGFFICSALKVPDPKEIWTLRTFLKWLTI